MVIRNTKGEKNKMYNYVYKLTLKSDTRYYYIGKHSTDKLEDGYLGSGKALKFYKEKYGKDCFDKEILSFWNSSEEALIEEAKLVNLSIINDEFCLNKMKGGGAFDSLGCKWGKRTEEQIQKMRDIRLGTKATKEAKQNLSNAIKNKWQDENYRKKQMINRKERYANHLEKISKERQGKICIIKEKQWKYIDKNEFEQYKNDGWKKRGIEITIEKIKQYRDEGLSYQKIANKYGVTESAIRTWYKKATKK